jgi:hypothetical protein
LLKLKIKSSLKFILFVFIFLYNFSYAQDKIAILYSNLIEKQSDIDSKNLLSEITSWELFLMQNKISYEVIYDDELESGIEDEFDILILPSVHFINRTQYESLKNFLNAGNSILNIGSKLYSSEDINSSFSNLENLFDIKNIRINQSQNLNSLHTISLNHINKFKNANKNVIQISNLNELMVFDQDENEELVCGSLIANDDPSSNKSSISYGKVGNGKYFWTGFGLNDIVGGKNDVEIFQQLIMNSLSWMDNDVDVYFDLPFVANKKPSVLFVEYSNALEPELIDVLNMNEYNPHLVVSSQTKFSSNVINKFSSDKIVLDLTSVYGNNSNAETIKELISSFEKDYNLKLSSVFINSDLADKDYYNIYNEAGIENILINANVTGIPKIIDDSLIELAISKKSTNYSNDFNIVYYTPKINCENNKEDYFIATLNQYEKGEYIFTTLSEVKKWWITKDKLSLKTISKSDKSIEFTVSNNSSYEANKVKIYFNYDSNLSSNNISISSGNNNFALNYEPNANVVFINLEKILPNTIKKFLVTFSEE